MNKDVFDKILDELIYEAVQDCDMIGDTSEDDSEVVFSKEHTEKMSKLFDEIRRKERLDRILSITKKVAIVIVVTTVAMAAFTPNINAWTEKIKKFFIREESKYSWIAYNDPSKVEDFNVATSEFENSGESDESVEVNPIDFLGYIPAGYEMTVLENSSRGKAIELEQDNKRILVKMLKNESSKALDTENEDIQSKRIAGFTVYYINKDSAYVYTWENKENIYRVLADNVDEESVIKIIENINYEKFENIF